MTTHETPIARDYSTGEKSRLRRSWWSVHALKLGLPENLVKKSYQCWVVPMVVVAPSRLCDDCNATGVGDDCWMDRHN